MENLSVSQCEGKIVICTFGNYLLIVMLGRNEGVRNMITCWTKLYSTRVESEDQGWSCSNNGYNPRYEREASCSTDSPSSIITHFHQNLGKLMYFWSVSNTRLCYHVNGSQLDSDDGVTVLTKAKVTNYCIMLSITVVQAEPGPW